MPQPENSAMHLIHHALLMFHVLELICYLLLFKFILDHDDDMLRRAVISDDVYRRRRQGPIRRSADFTSRIIFTCMAIPKTAIAANGKPPKAS
jgi:hypothetical protein